MSRYIEQSTRFKRQVKLAKKRGKDIRKLEKIIKLLIEDIELPQKNRDHQLIGNYKGCRECHIEPDWLLIYRTTLDNGLELVETGSHSDLFDS